MPEMFESLMYAARRELVVTTPYYVPDEPIQAALCASARRGVDDDDRLPGAQRQLDRGRRQPQLLRRAARRRACSIYEYVGGLLHTKSLTSTARSR